MRDEASGAFEVRSGEAGVLEAGEAPTHCTGEAQPGAASWAAPTLSVASRRVGCELAASVGAQYAGFFSSGLEYGPAYRELDRVWAHVGGALGSQEVAEGTLARLRGAAYASTVAVHPAQLDGALQLGAVLTPSGDAGRSVTRLPFAVDNAMLRRSVTDAYAVGTAMNAETVRLVPLLSTNVAGGGAAAGRRGDRGPDRCL